MASVQIPAHLVSDSSGVEWVGQVGHVGELRDIGCDVLRHLVARISCLGCILIDLHIRLVDPLDVCIITKRFETAC